MRERYQFSRGTDFFQDCFFYYYFFHSLDGLSCERGTACSLSCLSFIVIVHIFKIFVSIFMHGFQLLSACLVGGIQKI